MTILDASALLALLGAETGWERVAEALPESVISAVNLSEVVAKLADRGIPVGEVRRLLAGLGLAVAAFDSDAAFQAGELRRIEGGRHLSLGDRACLALARSRSAVALTADRDWADLDAGVAIELIR